MRSDINVEPVFGITFLEVCGDHLISMNKRRRAGLTAPEPAARLSDSDSPMAKFLIKNLELASDQTHRIF